MISIRRTPIWFSRQNETTMYRSWREGLTVRDVIEDPKRLGLWVAVNREPCDDLDRALKDGDEVLESTRPGGIESAVLTFVGKVLFYAGVTYILGKIVSTLTKSKKRNDNEGSATYAWSGLRNDRLEGQPKQVIYGQIRMAPQVLDEYLETRPNTGENDLNMLMAFGEGPITAVGDITTDTDSAVPLSSDDAANPLPIGIQIEGNSAENFGGVKAWVRMGTSEQESVPGFLQIYTDYSVGITLTQEETSNSNNSAIASALQQTPYNASANSAVWAAYGAAIDMTSEADAWSCLIDFPSGLYTITSNGSLALAYFRPQVRYIELDGGGSPITTGGDNSDGYVYVPLLAENDAAVAVQESFNYQMQGVFWDPATYSAPTQGKSLSMAATSGATTAVASTSATPTLPSTITTATDLAGFSFSVWVKLPTESYNGTFPQNSRRIQHRSGNYGWTFQMRHYVQQQPVTNNWLLGRKYDFTGGTGSGTWASDSIYDSTVIAQGGSQPTPTAVWEHLAVTYSRSDFDSKTRLRIYRNGVQIGTKSGSVGTLDVQLTNMAIAFGDISNTKDWQADEFLYVASTLSAAEVSQQYNNGIGRYNSAAVNQFALYHFDLAAGTVDSSGRGNALTTIANATAGTDAGLIYTGTTAEVKRGKYRVEVLRRNVKSTSNFVSDQSVFSQFIARDSATLTYPYTPILGMKIRATEQLNSSAPTVTALVKGVNCPVYDGAAVTYEWTNNPAWVALDIISNPRYGRGIEFPLSRCNLEDFKAWADYCDGLISAGRSFDDQAMDETASPGGTSPIQNLFYSSALNSSFGGIKIYFRWNSPTATVPPTYYKVGRFVGFSGVPTSGGGIAVNLNTSNISGYEITEIENTGTGWSVTVKYNTETYGDPWTDNQYWDTVVTPALVGTCQIVEPRFTYNGVFDDFTNAWDAMVSVCQTARAMPMIEGGIVRVRYERPRSPVAMVTMANIVRDSFKITFGDTINQPNSYSCDFLDEDRNYQRSVASFDDSDLDDTTKSYDLKRESIDLPGVTRRSQVMRQLDYLSRVNRLAKMAFDWQMSIDGLALEVGDVVQLSHDIMPYGQSGRVLQDSSSATSIYLDRDVTLAAGFYGLKIQASELGQVSTSGYTQDAFQVRVVSTGAGTVTLGTPIAVSSGFSELPKKGDQYTLYKNTEQLLVQIVEISMDEQFNRTVRAITYDATVYEVESGFVDLPLSVQDSDDEPQVNQRTIPNDVKLLQAIDTIQQQPDGSFVQVVSVRWDHDEETIRAVKGARVSMRETEDGVWALVGEVNGARNSLDVIVPDGTPGRVYHFCVQPVSFGGQFRRADQLTKLSIAMRGIWAAPQPPQSFTATMQGDQAVYTIAPPSNSRGLSYEIRRGGWILGQPVGVIPEGQTSISSTNWVGAGSNALGESAPKLYIRSRDSRGQYSRAVALEGFNPSPDGAVVLQPPYSDYTNYPDQAWEDFAASPGQWVNGALGQPQLSNLQVTLYNGRKVVEFSGSNLSGTYTTAGKLTMLTAQPEWAWVQFHAVVDQVSPWTVADLAALPVDSPISSNMTTEGLLAYPQASTKEFDYTKDYEPCAITVEMRFTTSAAGSFGDWVEYKPGYYNFVNVQFRVTFTRPDTTYNFRMYRCHSRLSRQAVGVWERSPVQDLVLKRMVSRG